MKFKIRFFSMLFTSLIIISMVIPVSAADFINDSWINLLDYDSVSDQGNFFYMQDGQPISFKLATPSNNVLIYGDFLVQYANDHAEFPSLTISFTDTITLYPIHLGGGLCRYFGKIPQGNYINMTFTFTPPSNEIYYATFLSANVSSSKFFAYELGCSALISAENQDDRTLVYNGSAVTTTIYDDYTSGSSASYFVMLTGDDWKLYDYVDIILGFYVGGVGSITANYGDTPLPISVSYLNSGLSSVVAAEYVNIRIDLRELDRSSDDDVLLTLSGLVGYGINLFSILGCQGYVDSSVNPLFYYFKDLKNNLFSLFSSLSSNLGNWFSGLTLSIESLGQNILDAINGDSSVADEFKQQVDESNKELNDMAAVMDSFTTPDVNSINVDVGSYISPTDLSSLTAPMGMLFESNIVTTCIIISIIMGTVMFVLYGKR